MRRLILDGGLPDVLAAELRSRGRPADHMAELGLGCATDAEVLALDGVLVTTVSIHARGATVALVSGNARDAVHRHAHSMSAQRAGSLRRYLG